MFHVLQDIKGYSHGVDLQICKVTAALTRRLPTDDDSDSLPLQWSGVDAPSRTPESLADLRDALKVFSRDTCHNAELTNKCLMWQLI